MTNILTAEEQILEVIGPPEQITVYDVAEPQVVEVETQAELVVIVEGNDNHVVDVVSPIVEIMQIGVIEDGPQGPPGERGAPPASFTINWIDDEISSLNYDDGRILTITKEDGEIVSVTDGILTKTLVRENGVIKRVIVT